MPLYQPERHEARTATPWREETARAAIAQIVADTHAAFTPDGLWPIHPADLSPERPSDSMKPLYNGAAGVIWAPSQLHASGFTDQTRDYTDTTQSLAARHAADIAANDVQRRYLENEIGPTAVSDGGIALLDWSLSPSAEKAKTLESQITARIGNNQGLIWGGAGTMLAALTLFERTGEERWRAFYLQHADALWQSWAHDPATGGYLWTVDLYGIVEKRLSALHGFFANAAVLLRGRHLLPESRQTELLARIAQTLHATAKTEDGFVNWPVSSETAGEPRAWYLQYCNGAPGAIVALADAPLPSQTERLLLAAGELIWRAGPPVKLPCLCHGVPAGGFAMLRLYARTGDPIWLDRARRFAMHGIEQADTALAKYGQRKFSLWTGDLGLAVFLAACTDGDPRFPILDHF